VAKFDRKTALYLLALGRKLRSVRLKQGVPQAMVHRATRIDRGNLVKYEKGQINVTIETLLRICHALGVEMEITFTAVRAPRYAEEKKK
jgi:transcriptional regulator with XRE-family HTH domain